MNSSSKIIIVDDNILFREVMKLLIEKEGLGEVVAEAENGQDFLDLLEKFNPDLVLMDIEMPVMGGFEATKKALEKKPDLRILVLTTFSINNIFVDIINSGAMGFESKSSGKKELEKAMKTVVNGECYFPHQLCYS